MHEHHVAYIQWNLRNPKIVLAMLAFIAGLTVGPDVMATLIDAISAMNPS
jgi:uncharacterized integral membrane protein